MKRWWKIIVLTLLILAGVGVMSLVVGGMFGGVAQAFSLIEQEAQGRGKQLARLKAQQFSGDDYVDETKMWERLEKAMDEDGHPVIREAHYENKEVAAGAEIEKIVVEAARCDLKLQEAEGDSYGISADDIPALQCYAKDGTLVVRINHNPKEQGHDGRVTLYLPRNRTISEVTLELGAGKLTAEPFQAEELTVRAGVGEISLCGLKAEDVTIESGMGWMEMRECEVTDDLVISTAMGGFCYQGRILGDVKAACGMGSVEMRVEGEREDFNYKTECAAGSIVIGEGGNTFWIGEHSLDNGAHKEMELECAMGAIEISFYENGGNGYE